MSGFLQHLVAKGRGEIQRLGPHVPQPFENSTPSPTGMALDVEVANESAAFAESSRPLGASPRARPMPSQGHPRETAAPAAGRAPSANPIAATPAQPLPARRAIPAGPALFGSPTVAPAVAPAAAAALPAVSRPVVPLPAAAATAASAPAASLVLNGSVRAASPSEMFSQATNQAPQAGRAIEVVGEARPVLPERSPGVAMPEDPVTGLSRIGSDPVRTWRDGKTGTAVPHSMPGPVVLLPPTRLPQRPMAGERPQDAAMDRRASETPIIEVLIDRIEVVAEAPAHTPARPSAASRGLSLDEFLDGAT